MAWLVVALVFGVGPLLAIIFDSVRQADAFTWDAYQVLFADRENNRFFSALWNSLRIGLTSALLASLLGAGLLIWLEQAPLRLRAGLEGLILLPMAFSTVVFGVAWFHLNQSWLEECLPVLDCCCLACDFGMPLLAPLGPANLESNPNSSGMSNQRSSAFLAFVSGGWFSGPGFNQPCCWLRFRVCALAGGTQFDPDDRG